MITTRNLKLDWSEDSHASEMVDHLLQFLQPTQFTFLYDVSDAPALDIVEYAKSLKVSSVIWE